VYSQRLAGRAGLIAWERKDVVVEGVRGLAKAVQRLDARLRIGELEEVVIHATPEEPILEEAAPNPAAEEDHGLQLDVESPDTVVAVELS
jgi:hypothetical protein